jgi:hypothetical protein
VSSAFCNFFNFFLIFIKEAKKEEQTWAKLLIFYEKSVIIESGFEKRIKWD